MPTQPRRGGGGFAGLGPAVLGCAGGPHRAGKGPGRPSRHVAAGSRRSQRESQAAFLIAVWLPRARREFFIRVISLPSLKAGKYHPGTQGARLPLNCSRVHRSWATSSNPMPECQEPGAPCLHPGGVFSWTVMSVRAVILQFSPHLLRKAFPLIHHSPVTHQTLLLGSFNPTDVFYIYLCNALINVCLPSSCPEPSRRSGTTSDFVFYSHCTP